MYNPVSTYRIQFNKEFTFTDFEKVIPYLQKLGVGAVYASPIFKAVPGSTHGYDTIDANMINPEIGSIDQLFHLSSILHKAGIGWIQDIVPNHMALHEGNAWLMDVLEKGPASAYHDFFDIEPGTKKLMIPLLSESIEEAIEKNEVSIKAVGGKGMLACKAGTFPLNEQSFATFTGYARQDAIEEINDHPEHIAAIHDLQHYRLCNASEANATINYRRFFTVNSLIGLNMQHAHVFDKFHEVIGRLLRENVFQGLRVDHIDGLSDPGEYLRRLRGLAGPEAYIVTEKILQDGEHLPDNWPVQGTTGYDSLAAINNVLTNRAGKKVFEKQYRRIASNTADPKQLAIEKKELILYRHMRGELQNLVGLLCRLFPALCKNVVSVKLEEALAAFLVRVPGYRYYADGNEISADTRAALAAIIKEIKQSGVAPATACKVLEKIWLTPSTQKSEAQRALQFFRRCMQFTGPLTAKGIEDTLMYTCNRLISHNEVGDSVHSFGTDVKTFHSLMQQRQCATPFAMNTTATHDTKRGEDARARLNVLADIPVNWFDTVQQWHKINAHVKEGNMPDANDEYFIYQCMLASYPGNNNVDNYRQRLHVYIEKAVREAKTHSEWSAPDMAYENAAQQFADGIWNGNVVFQKGLHSFYELIAAPSFINSISQLVLKHTIPGIPDTYQGTELWDLSYVDPDNRRPVDYHKRASLLDEIRTATSQTLQQWWGEREQEKVKLLFTHILLQARKAHPALFAHGEYIPLKVTGTHAKNVLSYARRYRNTWILIAIPLFPGTLLKDSNPFNWRDTRIALPGDAPREFDHLLLQQHQKTEGDIYLRDVSAGMMPALLQLSYPKTTRGAGILLPVYALPAHIGIGDFGPAAKQFADFLLASGQKYWQILPLTPVQKENGYSPYSSTSGMAGNPFFVSIEKLVDDGLLPADVKTPARDHGTKVDYAYAKRIKDPLLGRAYQSFLSQSDPVRRKPFEDFCKKEHAWLHDFALYTILREEHTSAPWKEWPAIFRDRHPGALKEFASANSDRLDLLKWKQFIFHKQWLELKAYCNERGIQIIGDLPFYVGYNSADVWAHRDLFMLDAEGNMQGVAGVPPDYFTADGQLWNMPTFNWTALRNTGYEWWIARLKKSSKLFDLIRLDHFRAFESYWEVPASEKTARSGKWMDGPRGHFFDAVNASLGDLPFVAEDLGDNMQAVYAFRDNIKLPGMKVLQFGFGDNMPYAVDAPHAHARNNFVYTGTHDNNTLRGWFNKEADESTIRRLQNYTGRKVNRANVHEVFTAIAYASVGDTAIVPMQDILGLDETARTNTPGVAGNNWRWGLAGTDEYADKAKYLRTLVWRYGRI